MDLFSNLKSLTRINVLGNEWTIKFVPRAELDGDDGEACADDQLIRIADDLEGLRLRKTFLHEYRHAVQYDLGLEQILDKQAMEIDAESFASQFLSVLGQLKAA